MPNRLVELWEAERKAVKPPDRMTPTEWAEANVELPSGAPPGPFRIANAPHWREPLDQLANPFVRRIVIMAPAQVGKTTYASIALAYWNDQDAYGDCMWILPNKDDAADFNVDRFQPILRDSPTLRGLITGRKTDERGDRFRSTSGMTTYFRGAGSSAGLASLPCRKIAPDEVDKYADFLGREADPISLARARQRTFPLDSIEICTSTPTNTAGPIWREWLASDQREYHVRCQSCGLYQPLVTEQLRWPKGASPDDIAQGGLAVFECVACQHPHDERGRQHMLEEGGVWVPAGAEIDSGGRVHGALERPSHVGYHLTQLNVRSTPMSEFAASFLRCRVPDDPTRFDRERLRDFRNSWEGWVFEDTVGQVREHDLRELCLPNAPKVIPAGAAWVVATVDTQGQSNGFYYVIRAYGPGVSWLIDEGHVVGPSFDTLERVLTQWFPSAAEHGPPWPVQLVLIDAGGHRTQDVYAWSRPRAGRMFEVRPIFGKSSISDGRPFSSSAIDQGAGHGRQVAGGLRRWTLNVGLFADQLATLIRGTQEGDTSMKWFLHNNPSDGYLRELTAEHKVSDRRTGRQVWKQKTKGRANHRLDCERYQLAAAAMYRWDALQEGHKYAPPKHPSLLPEQSVGRSSGRQVSWEVSDGGGGGSLWDDPI